MASKQIKSRHYKSLPPHTYEAHPLARMGEVNKTLVISIIVFLALIVLALFLFVAKPLAGKAVAFPPSILNPMSIGASISRIPLQGHAATNEEFSLPISANIVSIDGTTHETVAISFKIRLAAGVSCPTRTQSLLGWTAENGSVTDDSNIHCENGIISFTAATVNPFVAKRNSFNIVNFTFAGLPQGRYPFTVYDSVVIDLATSEPFNLAMHSPVIFIQTVSYECLGNSPFNARLCAGDDQNLPADTQNSLVSSCTDRKCEYTCVLPLVLEGGICVRPTFQCTGTAPEHTRICDGDAVVDANTPLQLVDACTAVECELVCDTGFHRNGATCVANIPLPGPACGNNVIDPGETCLSCVADVSCVAGQRCSNTGTCVEIPPPPPGVQSARGTKIIVEEIGTVGNLYQTKITATENITTSFTVVTQLSTLDGRNTVIEVRTITPMRLGDTKIIGTQSLREDEISRKRVAVYDTPDPSRWTVHLNNGTFDVTYPPR